MSISFVSMQVLSQFSDIFEAIMFKAKARRFQGPGQKVLRPGLTNFVL